MTEFELLQGLSPDDRRQVIASCTPRKFAKREIVCHEGDPGDSLHLITSGRLLVKVTTPLGHVATLTILGAGDSFGELALLSPDARRTATVVAVENSATLMLRRDRLDELRRRHRQIDRMLTDTLAAQVRRLSAMVLEALYLPVDTRVIRRLVHLARVYDGEIKLTQEDLASMAGTTRATANQILRELEDKGVLVLGRGTVTILDPRALTKIARY